jgi:hypothetical protein
MFQGMSSAFVKMWAHSAKCFGFRDCRRIELEEEDSGFLASARRVRRVESDTGDCPIWAAWQLVAGPIFGA